MVWWGFQIWTNLDETRSNKTIRENSWLLKLTQRKKYMIWHVHGRNGWDVSSNYSYILLWMFLRQLLVECGLMYVDPPHVFQSQLRRGWLFIRGPQLDPLNTEYSPSYWFTWGWRGVDMGMGQNSYIFCIPMFESWLALSSPFLDIYDGTIYGTIY